MSRWQYTESPGFSHGENVNSGPYSTDDQQFTAGPSRNYGYGQVHPTYADNYPSQYAAPAPQPPGYLPFNYAGPQPVKYQDQKSMFAAVILALLGGSFGLHNLYLGYIVRGMCQFSLFLIGVILSIFLVGFIFLGALWLWVLVEIMLMLVNPDYTDSKGVPLRR